MNTRIATKHLAAHRETSHTRDEIVTHSVGRVLRGASNMTKRRDREVWHQRDAVHLAEGRVRRQTAAVPRTHAHDCAVVAVGGPPAEQQT